MNKPTFSISPSDIFCRFSSFFVDAIGASVSSVSLLFCARSLLRLFLSLPGVTPCFPQLQAPVSLETRRISATRFWRRRSWSRFPSDLGLLTGGGSGGFGGISAVTNFCNSVTISLKLKNTNMFCIYKDIREVSSKIKRYSIAIFQQLCGTKK